MKCLQKSKEDMGIPELELQAVVSHLMGSGNYTQVLYKNSKCFKLLSSFPRPAYFTFKTESMS